MPGRVGTNLHYGWAEERASPHFTWDCPCWSLLSLSSRLFSRGQERELSWHSKEWNRADRLWFPERSDFCSIQFKFIHQWFAEHLLGSFLYLVSLNKFIRITVHLGRYSTCFHHLPKEMVWMIKVITKGLRVPWMLSLINSESEWALANPQVTE